MATTTMAALLSVLARWGIGIVVIGHIGFADTLYSGKSPDLIESSLGITAVDGLNEFGIALEVECQHRAHNS
jgi:hypothetical protein